MFAGLLACLFHCSSRSPSSALLPFLREGSRTKTDYRKKGTLILTSLLEDLVVVFWHLLVFFFVFFPWAGRRCRFRVSARGGGCEQHLALRAPRPPGPTILVHRARGRHHGADDRGDWTGTGGGGG